MLDRYKNKLMNFWVLHTIGWLGWGFLNFLFLMIYYSEQGLTFKSGKFYYYIYATATGYLLSLTFSPIFRKIRSMNLSFARVTAIVISLVVLTAFGWSIICENYWWFIGKCIEPITWRKMPYKVFDGAIIFTVWSALYFLIKYWKELETQKENTLKATALAHQAQLQMLRYQLNPHFLFNALNSIRAMISEDTTRARNMITELSEFLRYSLVNGNKTEVTLGDEIEAIQNYLEIEKIRYEDRLDVKIDIKPSAEEYPIPGFLIHPLVENAIKYGMHTSDIPLKIKIYAEKKENKLIVEVSNTGKWIDHEENRPNLYDGTGTGLNNIKQRLKHLFPDRFIFDVTEEDGWIKAKIEISIP